MVIHAINASSLEEIYQSILKFGTASDSSFLRKRNSEQIAYNCYIKGKNLLKCVVDLYSKNTQLSADSHTIAITNLADWYFIFNK